MIIYSIVKLSHRFKLLIKFLFCNPLKHLLLLTLLARLLTIICLLSFSYLDSKYLISNYLNLRGRLTENNCELSLLKSEYDFSETRLELDFWMGATKRPMNTHIKTINDQRLILIYFCCERWFGSATSFSLSTSTFFWVENDKKIFCILIFLCYHYI